MDCTQIEEWLSAYMESSLPADEMNQVKKHLVTCPNCSDLLNAVQSVIKAGDNFPAFELDPDLLERILLRTSGRPRTLSFRERFNKYLIRPLLTPRLAAGISLATLFLAFTTYLMAPRVSAVMSSVSPMDLLQLMDRGVQQLYGEGLKAYYKKKDLQAQLKYFKDSNLNKLHYMIDQINAPVEIPKKSDAPRRDKEMPSGQKSSWMRLRADQLG
jgi:hypothetical protein